MTPFELPFAMMRQWMDLSAAMTKAAADMMSESANQARRDFERLASGQAMLSFAPSHLTAANPFLAAFGMQPSWSPFAMWGAPMMAFPGMWGGAGWPGSLGMPGTSANAGLMWPWMGFGMWDSVHGGGALGRRPQLPALELMEQAAGAYRSASGYAVAAILSPLAQSGVTNVQPTVWWAPMFGNLKR